MGHFYVARCIIWHKMCMCKQCKYVVCIYMSESGFHNLLLGIVLELTSESWFFTLSNHGPSVCLIQLFGARNLCPYLDLFDSAPAPTQTITTVAWLWSLVRKIFCKTIFHSCWKWRNVYNSLLFFCFLSLFFIHYFSSLSTLCWPSLCWPCPFPHAWGKLGHGHALGPHEREGVGDQAPFLAPPAYSSCGASLLKLFQVWTFGWRSSKATGGRWRSFARWALISTIEATSNIHIWWIS